MDHENLNLSTGNNKTRSSKIADENAKCRVEFERSYNYYLQLVAACSTIARTSVKVRKTKLLPSIEENIRASFALSTRQFTSLR